MSFALLSHFFTHDEHDCIANLAWYAVGVIVGNVMAGTALLACIAAALTAGFFIRRRRSRSSGGDAALVEGPGLGSEVEHDTESVPLKATTDEATVNPAGSALVTLHAQPADTALNAAA